MEDKFNSAMLDIYDQVKEIQLLISSIIKELNYLCQTVTSGNDITVRDWYCFKDSFIFKRSE